METNIYKERMLAFAKHIKTIEYHPTQGLFRRLIVYLCTNNIAIPIKVRTPHWLFEELIACFPEEWSFHEITGDPTWDEMDIEANTSECVCDFFGINDYQIYCHLWDINGIQNVERWGGQILTEESNGPVLGQQMMDYISKSY